jgi:hypothetical protein
MIRLCYTVIYKQLICIRQVSTAAVRLLVHCKYSSFRLENVNLSQQNSTTVLQMEIFVLSQNPIFTVWSPVKYRYQVIMIGYLAGSLANEKAF